MTSVGRGPPNDVALGRRGHRAGLRADHRRDMPLCELCAPKSVAIPTRSVSVAMTGVLVRETGNKPWTLDQPPFL
jgi:hypothetical protein